VLLFNPETAVIRFTKPVSRRGKNRIVKVYILTPGGVRVLRHAHFAGIILI
jgi:hypothetical protein